MKISQTVENITTKMLQTTIELQKRQITIHRDQVRRHERLLKQLMQELDYPSWKISATIMANYKDHE